MPSLNPFSKPEVVIESDDELPGTGWRVCSVRVSGRVTDQSTQRRVCDALRLLSPASSAEAVVVPVGNMTRFRLRYFGDRIASERVLEAVRKAL